MAEIRAIIAPVFTVTFPDFTPLQWTLAILAALCCGVSKAGLAGVGMLTVLLMAEIIPGKSSSGAVLPLLIFADVLAAALFRREVLWPHIRSLALPIFGGIVAGWLVMLRLPDAAFRPLIGWMVLLMLATHLAQSFRADPERPPAMPEWFTRGVGFFTGFATMIANAAGPIASIYLLMARLPRSEFIATMAWLFLIVNLVKVPFSLHLGLISPGSLTLNALLFPLVAAGLLFGRALVLRVPRKPFQFLVLGLAALSAFRLIAFS